MIKPIEELVAMRGAIADKMQCLKSELSDVDSAIAHIAAPSMDDKLQTMKKTYGSFKLSVDGVALQCEIRKTVRWDSDKLKAAASKIDAGDAAAIFTVALSVSEERMKDLEELEHPAIGEILLARTVTYSAFSARPVEKSA